MPDTHTFPVDPSNADQADDWDGDDGAYWATYHEEYERLLQVFDVHLLDAADVRPTDRALDVGCGTGATSRALATRATAGSALGVDLSGPMLQTARAHPGPANLSYLQADAQVYAFEPGSFDVAVSRVGCMFFGDTAAAFANIGRALRPGGRLALVVWQAQARNRWITQIDVALGEEADADGSADPGPVAPGPFALADADRCRTLLDAAGFVDVAIAGLEVPLSFGRREDAEAFLLTWVDEDLDEAGRERATEALRQLLADNESDGAVRLESATWLITARRPG